MDNQTLMPLWDYALLERDDDKKSRIIRPENTDPTKIGTLELTVLFAGPECRNIKPGDRLIFNPQAAVTFSHEGKQYWLISERATGVVVAKLRKIEKCPDGRLPL
jgi:hypothetical protein